MTLNMPGMLAKARSEGTDKNYWTVDLPHAYSENEPKGGV